MKWKQYQVQISRTIMNRLTRLLRVQISMMRC